MAAQNRRRRLIPWVALTCLLSAFHPVHGEEPRPGLEQVLEEVGIEPIARPTKAPAFALATLEGQTVSLADYQGRLVLLHVWATWSRQAPFEMANLEKLQKALPEEPFTVLAVATDVAGKPAVEAFVQEYTPSVLVLLDPQGQVPERYAVRGVPTSILIGGHGHVIGRAVGARPWDSPSMIEALKRLVEAPGSYGIITGGASSTTGERSR
ncbi:MAG: TlpA disulfide reductase family protein [Candidatus Tectimicrobiota bacterium]